MPRLARLGAPGVLQHLRAMAVDMGDMKNYAA